MEAALWIIRPGIPAGNLLRRAVTIHTCLNALADLCLFLSGPRRPHGSKGHLKILDTVDASRMRSSLLCVLTVLGTACETPSEPLEEFPDVRAWTVGNAAAALGPDGRFRLPDPRQDPARLQIVSPERALELALSWKAERFQGISRGGVIEGLHGAPINWDEIRTADHRPILFQEAVYEPLPEDTPFFLQVAMGPEYVIPLYQNSTQAAVLSANAHGSHLSIDEGGQISRDTYMGVEFTLQVLPRNAEAGLPPSPERAAVSVASAVGVPVTEVPRLIRPPSPRSAALASWEVVLAEEVEVAILGSTGRTLTDTVFVSSEVHAPGWRGGAYSARMTFNVAHPDQPRQDTILIDVESIEEDRIPVDVVRGIPIKFLEVSLD